MTVIFLVKFITLPIKILDIVLEISKYSQCSECVDIEVWEDPSCSERLNRLRDYKKNLVKFEFDDDYEIKQQKGMINDLSAMISKLESLKKKDIL